VLPPAELLRLEAEGERRTAALVAEAKTQAGDRCPECGSLGSLELVDGVTRCLDCDLEIMERSRLGGLGKKLPRLGGGAQGAASRSVVGGSSGCASSAGLGLTATGCTAIWNIRTSKVLSPKAPSTVASGA